MKHNDRQNGSMMKHNHRQKNDNWMEVTYHLRGCMEANFLSSFEVICYLQQRGYQKKTQKMHLRLFDLFSGNLTDITRMHVNKDKKALKLLQHYDSDVRQSLNEVIDFKKCDKAFFSMTNCGDNCCIYGYLLYVIREGFGITQLMPRYTEFEDLCLWFLQCRASVSVQEFEANLSSIAVCISDLYDQCRLFCSSSVVQSIENFYKKVVLYEDSWTQWLKANMITIINNLNDIGFSVIFDAIKKLIRHLACIMQHWKNDDESDDFDEYEQYLFDIFRKSANLERICSDYLSIGYEFQRPKGFQECDNLLNGKK